MKLTHFDPPGHLDDLDAAQKAAWSRFISDRIDAAVAGSPEEFDFDAPRAQFFNPTRQEIEDDQQSLDISWTAFPKVVQSASVSDKQRWKTADSSRDVQDEYCEWSVDRDDQGKLTRVTFTCEGPEYWEFLAASSPAKVLALDRRFVSPEVKEGDLFDSQGGYDTRNRWNNSTSGGVMHLIQGANTLGAEIELAGGASVVRLRNGKLLTGEAELIQCGRYGEPGRHSDPHIGERVNALTRQKANVTLANPIGLYFNDLVTAGWTTPDGADPKSFWTIARGTAEKPVRAVFEVPAAKGYVVGYIKISGRAIDFGAQIADFITMKLTGTACGFGKSPVAPMEGCKSRRAFAAVAGVAAPASVESALKGRRRTR